MHGHGPQLRQTGCRRRVEVLRSSGCCRDRLRQPARRLPRRCGKTDADRLPTRDLGGQQAGNGVRLPRSRPADDDGEGCRGRDRRLALPCRPPADGHGDGALVDPLPLGVQATAEQDGRPIVEDCLDVDCGHDANSGTAHQRRLPRLRFWPRERWPLADVAVRIGSGAGQLDLDVGGDRREVDAGVPMLGCPDGEGDGEHNVGGCRLGRHQLADDGCRVHLGTAEHPGIDPRLQVCVRSHQCPPPPRNRSSRASTVRVGGCHVNTPYGVPASVGVAAPTMPRMNR